MFDIHCSLYGAFTMDVIARCGFGLKLDSQKNKDDPFVKNAKKLFNFSTTDPVTILTGKLGIPTLLIATKGRCLFSTVGAR